MMKENERIFPPAIAEKTNGKTYHTDDGGRAESEVLLFGDMVLKIEKTSELADNEEKMMKQILLNAASYGKNVFYVYSGTKPQLKIENGIRYISLGKVSEYKTASRFDDGKYCSYIVFYISGNEIRYELMQEEHYRQTCNSIGYNQKND